MHDHLFPARARVRALLTAAVLLCAGFAPSAGRSAEPYQIDAILSLTGQAAFIGKQEAQALGVEQDLVNRQGGIAGRPIRFVVQDDQSNPQLAVQLANGVISRHAAILIGPSLSGTCNAIAPLQKEGPVSFCLSPGIHPPEGSYVFSPSPSSVDLGLATARYLRDRGIRKVAFIFSTDESGQDGERSIDTAFAQPQYRAETLVVQEHFNVTDVSVAAQIAHVKASGAEVLDAWASGTPVATVLRGADQAGLELPVITSVSNATYPQMHAYASFMPKELLFVGPPSLAPDQLPNGRIKQAVRAYEAAMRAAGIRPEHGHAIVWDAGLLAVDALRKLGTGADASRIRAYVANLRGWQGISGSYDFRALPQRGLDASSLLMARWDPAKDAWIGISGLGGGR